MPVDDRTRQPIGVLHGGASVALGRRTQVWEIRVTDDDGRLVCVSRCTMAVVPKPT